MNDYVHPRTKLLKNVHASTTVRNLYIGSQKLEITYIPKTSLQAALEPGQAIAGAGAVCEGVPATFRAWILTHPSTTQHLPKRQLTYEATGQDL
jgi:hypothetical protein